MKRFILPLILVLSFGLPALAHGIHCDVEQIEHTVIVACSYDSGTPAAHAAVLVYAPHESGEAFQNGETDNKGKFVFLPDADGAWHLVVDDGTGHRHEIDVILEQGTTTVAEETVEHQHDVSAENTPAQSNAPIPLVYKVIFGLGLIFGATGIFYGLKARHRQT